MDHEVTERYAMHGEIAKIHNRDLTSFVLDYLFHQLSKRFIS